MTNDAPHWIDKRVVHRHNMFAMSSVPFMNAAAVDPAHPAGLPLSVPLLDQYLQALTAKFKPARLPLHSVTSEGQLSLVAVGSQTPAWTFDSALEASDGSIKASGHCRDIEYSFEIRYELTEGQASLSDYHFHFRLLPNPTADTALWFHQFFFAAISEKRVIRLRLQAKDVQFLLSLQVPPKTHIDTALTQELNEYIEFYMELQAIGSTFEVEFRIPEIITPKDRILAHRVFKMINDGWADCNCNTYTYPPDPNLPYQPEPRFLWRDVDVWLTEKHFVVQLLGHELELGPMVFIAPSAFIRPIGSSQIEIDYTRFGGYAYLPGFVRQPDWELASQEIAQQDWLDHLRLSEPKILSELKETPPWPELLSSAKAEQTRREALLNLVESAERRSRRQLHEQACAFVSNNVNRTRYAGQWVALEGGRVVAMGAHPTEVHAEAERQGIARPIIHFFPARDPDVVYWGGWQ
jgi:hypothetical protein